MPGELPTWVVGRNRRILTGAALRVRAKSTFSRVPGRRARSLGFSWVHEARPHLKEKGTAQIAVEISFKIGAAARGFLRSVPGPPGGVPTATEKIKTIFIAAVVQRDGESAELRGHAMQKRSRSLPCASFLRNHLIPPEANFGFRRRGSPPILRA